MKLEHRPGTIAPLTRPLRHLLVAALAMFFLGRIAGANENDSLAQLLAADRAYERGVSLAEKDPTEAKFAFEQAAAEYSALAEGGIRNAELHLNLANSLLQAGDRGGAILEYLRARDLSPADPRVAANLAFARTQVPGRPSMGQDPSLVDRLASWWHVVPLPSRGLIAAIAWTLFWALLIWRLGWSRPRAEDGDRRPVWGYAAAAALLIAGVIGFTVAADLVEQRDRSRGVVISDGVVVRKGNGDGFEAAADAPLASGIEFIAVDRRPNWILIRLGDGRSGWVPERDVAFVASST